MDKFKNPLSFLLLLLISSYGILRLFPYTHPYGGLNLPLDADAIESQSRTLLMNIGLNPEGLTAQSRLKYDKELFREVEERFGLERSNELMRNGVRVHSWEVTWKKSTSMMYSMGENGDDSKQVEQKVAEIIRGSVFTRFGTDGKLMEFDQKVPDSLQLPSLQQVAARALAVTFLRDYGAASAWIADTTLPMSEKRIDQRNRTDFEFVWDTRAPVLDDPMTVKVVIAGNRVVQYEEKIDVPEIYKKGSTLESAVQVILPIIYMVVVLMMIIVAFRRFRSFELGFRLATIIGTVAALMLGVEIYMTIQTDTGWEILIPLILGPLFFGGGLVLVWAVSESVTREVWKEKLITFDLLSKGYAFHSRVGEQVVRGIALGLAGLALSCILTYVGGRITQTSVVHVNESVIEGFGAVSSWLYVLGHAVSVNVYKVSIIVLFGISFLRKRFSSAFVLILAGSILVSLTTQTDLAPLWMGILIHACVAAVTVWGFYRYDALVAFLSLYTFTVFQETAGLLLSGNSSYTGSGYIVIGLFAVLLLAGLASQVRKKEITDFDVITPAFAKHITERQRLQQELEIARAVQMSFLPKSNPRMVELDIASRCAPALEVGGDYYDFMDLSDKKLGVVVGDVSGKGTQAAFFMTLTKGFVHALAESSRSASAVLTQVNKLFYENVDRGVFISMVYGIFDTAGRTLTLARAGHNPVIMRKTQENQVQIVNPMGLALGLDPGDTFSKSIQEVTIPFQSGDLFVFYTDGFPEAMNKTLEEFGEDRLCETVQRYAQGSAAEIMDGVFADMRQFVGKAKQHDDMTIVVVKIV